MDCKGGLARCTEQDERDGQLEHELAVDGTRHIFEKETLQARQDRVKALESLSEKRREGKRHQNGIYVEEISTYFPSLYFGELFFVL